MKLPAAMRKHTHTHAHLSWCHPSQSPPLMHSPLSLVRCCCHCRCCCCCCCCRSHCDCCCRRFHISLWCRPMVRCRLAASWRRPDHVSRGVCARACTLASGAARELVKPNKCLSIHCAYASEFACACVCVCVRAPCGCAFARTQQSVRVFEQPIVMSKRQLRTRKPEEAKTKTTTTTRSGRGRQRARARERRTSCMC